MKYKIPLFFSIMVILIVIFINIKPKIYNEFELNNNLKFKLENHSINIPKGTYSIEKNIIIPENIRLNIEPGTILKLSSKVSIIKFGEITLKGTQLEPIIIKPIDLNKPFGTFTIIGNNNQIEIEFLELYGGSKTKINNIKSTGGLTITNGNITLKNLKIHDNQDDDGLNIKNSTIYINNCNFFNNFADQLDVDKSKGQINNSSFYDFNQNKFSEGIDFGYSQIKLSNNIFINLKKQGISIGEMSKIVAFNNTFINNNREYLIKENSSMIFNQNKIIYNNHIFSII